MKRDDDFKKLSTDGFSSPALLSIFESALVVFRIKTLIVFTLHMIFATLYACEYNYQVAIHAQEAAINAGQNNELITAASCSDCDLTSELAYTPASSMAVMVLNLILGLLVA